MNTKQLKIVTGIAIMVLIVSIIPILWISQYLHPFGDDYVFGAEVYKIWNETHSFPACIQAAWNVAMTMYHTWQGTYSACFLMALQPGVFGQYWLGPIILLFSLAGSTYTLLYMVMRKLLHSSKLEYLFVSTLFVLMTIQFTWSYYDAFFWYNGAMYYTLFYSLSLTLASLLICYQQVDSKFKKAIIGGGIHYSVYHHCWRKLCFRTWYGSNSICNHHHHEAGTKKMAKLLYDHSRYLWHRLPLQRTGTRQRFPTSNNRE